MTYKPKLQPQTGVTYYQKRGAKAFSKKVYDDPKQIAAALESLKKTGYFAAIGLYAVQADYYLVWMQLTQAGKEHFDHHPEFGGQWSTEQAK